MMLLIEHALESEKDLEDVMSAYRAKGTPVDITMRIPMCPELFMDELELGLFTLGMDSFASYKNIDKLNMLIMCRLYEMLDWYAEADPDGASLTAESLMHRLEELDTDDDVFPEYQLEILSKYLKRLPADYRPKTEFDEDPGVESAPMFD